MWFDSHCHLQDEPDPQAALGRAESAGVGAIVCAGTDEGQSRRAIDLAFSYAPSVWATVGLHPHDAAQGVAGVERLISEVGVGGAGRVVAIGECGLDYHYDRSPRAAQREAFAFQVSLARELAAALIIHTRDAWEDTLDVLRAEGPPERTVFHCFTGGPGEARLCLDLGAYLSFSGIVTFANAAEVRDAAGICPAERLLVETDSPYLAPVPHRGQRNEPAFVPLVGAAVAAARGVAIPELERSSWEAAVEAFDLGRPVAPR